MLNHAITDIEGRQRHKDNDAYLRPASSDRASSGLSLPQSKQMKDIEASEASAKQALSDNASQPAEPSPTKSLVDLITGDATVEPRAASKGTTQTVRPTSPAIKKHRCPHCNADFTRHHNFKCHLLTHSEGNFIFCYTCEARFLCVYDLEQHTELQHGERTHLCPNCDRRFSIADDLALHNEREHESAGDVVSHRKNSRDDENVNEFDMPTADAIPTNHPVSINNSSNLYASLLRFENIRKASELPKQAHDSELHHLSSSREHHPVYDNSMFAEGHDVHRSTSDTGDPLLESISERDLVKSSRRLKKGHRATQVCLNKS